MTDLHDEALIKEARLRVDGMHWTGDFEALESDAEMVTALADRLEALRAAVVAANERADGLQAERDALWDLAENNPCVVDEHQTLTAAVAAANQRAERAEAERDVLRLAHRTMVNACDAANQRAERAEIKRDALRLAHRTMVNACDAANQRAERAEIKRDAAYSVIRRYRDGWMPVEEPQGEDLFDRWYLEPGIDDGPETDALGNQPMTPAEAEAILRALVADQPATGEDTT